ncbi:MAG TPA: hypothetical protein PLV21_06685 [Cyclobacteriaceae bacterium]|nr:hypothetical protein [Cyclobacteriaceae bacterium]HRJ81549.1 hypothetical protein [Cyclobacteriaceae bacterium]
MKKILMPISFLILTILVTGCADTTQKTEENLDRLQRMALSLDSLIEVEVRKLNMLDSAIENEVTKTRKLDSMINQESKRIDSLVNKIYKRIEQSK